MSGKGDKRRPGKPGAYEDGYDAIDWSRGRPDPVAPKADPMTILAADYTTPAGWVIPPLETFYTEVERAEFAAELVRRQERGS